MITNILGEYDEAMHYLDQIGVIRGNGEALTLKERIIRMVQNGEGLGGRFKELAEAMGALRPCWLLTDLMVEPKNLRDEYGLGYDDTALVNAIVASLNELSRYRETMKQIVSAAKQAGMGDLCVAKWISLVKEDYDQACQTRNQLRHQNTTLNNIITEAFSRISNALMWVPRDRNSLDLPAAIDSIIAASMTRLEEKSNLEEINAMQAKEVARLSGILSDRGPEGRSVRNGDFVALMEENDRLAKLIPTEAPTELEALQKEHLPTELIARKKLMNLCQEAHEPNSKLEEEAIGAFRKLADVLKWNHSVHQIDLTSVVSSIIKHVADQDAAISDLVSQVISLTKNDPTVEPKTNKAAVSLSDLVKRKEDPSKLRHVEVQYEANGDVEVPPDIPFFQANAAYADLNKAHAEGKTIQHNHGTESEPNWRDIPSPEFIADIKRYRIKPEEVPVMNLLIESRPIVSSKECGGGETESITDDGLEKDCLELKQARDQGLRVQCRHGLGGREWFTTDRSDFDNPEVSFRIHPEDLMFFNPMAYKEVKLGSEFVGVDFESPVKEAEPEMQDNFLKEWEKWVAETATYFDCGNGDITYPLLGLVGELGELVNSIVKYYRKSDLITLKIQHLPAELRQKLKDESYDALHFLMFLLNEQGISLSEIISYGREKLEKRMEEGTVHKENRIGSSIVGKTVLLTFNSLASKSSSWACCSRVLSEATGLVTLGVDRSMITYAMPDGTFEFSVDPELEQKFTLVGVELSPRVPIPDLTEGSFLWHIGIPREAFYSFLK
jgi:NTP pyrophosphatase (non-canonical NTP hydrolase)